MATTTTTAAAAATAAPPGPGDQSEIYFLAPNKEEFARLDHQHFLFKSLVGANYRGPVQDVLKSEDHADGRSRAILDLGCGSGIWAIDMAKEFPHCRVLGIDLSPITRPMPENCRVEKHDINEGLERFNGEFDVVNARLIASGIVDYRALVDQVSKVLRPGGLFLGQDWDFRTCDENKIAYPEDGGEDATIPWFARFVIRLHTAVRARTGNIDAAVMLGEWLGDHPSYISVEVSEVWIPSGPWFDGETEEGKRLNHLGKLMQEDCLRMVASCRPAFMHLMGDEEAVDDLLEKTRDELENVSGRTWVKVTMTWAKKAA